MPRFDIPPFGCFDVSDEASVDEAVKSIRPQYRGIVSLRLGVALRTWEALPRVQIRIPGYEEEFGHLWRKPPEVI